MTAVALESEAVPTARELLPHAEASARSWRNTKVALIGAPLSLLGLFGSALMISVGIAGESSGEELAVLLGIMIVVLLIGVSSTAHSVWAYRNDPGCKALRSEQVVRVDYGYMQQLTGYQKQATYTVASGARYACFVPNDFGG